MPDDNTTLVFAVFLAGIGLGVPLGYLLAAYFIKPKTSIVTFERDNNGRIAAIVEKQL